MSGIHPARFEQNPPFRNWHSTTFWHRFEHTILCAALLPQVIRPRRERDHRAPSDCRVWSRPRRRSWCPGPGCRPDWPRVHCCLCWTRPGAARPSVPHTSLWCSLKWDKNNTCELLTFLQCFSSFNVRNTLQHGVVSTETEILKLQKTELQGKVNALRKKKTVQFCQPWSSPSTVPKILSLRMPLMTIKSCKRHFQRCKSTCNWPRKLEARSYQHQICWNLCSNWRLEECVSITALCERQVLSKKNLSNCLCQHHTFNWGSVASGKMWTIPSKQKKRPFHTLLCSAPKTCRKKLETKLHLLRFVPWKRVQ